MVNPLSLIRQWEGLLDWRRVSDSLPIGNREVEVCLVVKTPGGGRVSWLRASTPRPGRGMTSPGSVHREQRTGTCLTWWVVVSVVWGLVFLWIISPSAMGYSSPDKIGQSGGVVEVCNALSPLKGVV